MSALRSLATKGARRIFEALSGTLLGDYGAGTDSQLYGFRPLSDRVRMGRDLDPLAQQDMIRMAVRLYAQNNLARWLVDMPVSLVVGQDLGYTVSIDHAKADMDEEEAADLEAAIRDVLDLFWKHPAHSIQDRADEYATTMLVTGELLLPVAKVNDVNGVPELDYFDASLIKEVLPLAGSSMVAGKALYTKGNDAIPATFDIIHENPRTQLLEGQAFLFALRPLLNSMRGVSYLMDVADWVDSRDQFLWAAVDKATQSNNLVWDVKMTGATPTVIEAESKRLRSENTFAKPGTHYVHNDQTELAAVHSAMEAGENAEVLRMMRLDILGSKSMPESWYAEGGNANRATAGEQTDVSYRALSRLQRKLRNVFRILLRYAYENAQTKNRQFPVLAESPWLSIEPDMPVLSERDAVRMTSAVSQLEAALEGAVAGELVSKETGRKVFLTVLSKVTDQPIAIDEEKALIETETEEREKAAMEKSNELIRKGLMDDDEGDDGGGPPRDPPQPDTGKQVKEAVDDLSHQVDILSERMRTPAPASPPPSITTNITLPPAATIPAPQVTVEGAKPANVVVNIPEAPPQPAPQVTVIAEAKAPNVVIQPTPVTVIQGAAPIVHAPVTVNVPPAAPLKVERDKAGKITGITPEE